MIIIPPALFLKALFDLSGIVCRRLIDSHIQFQQQLRLLV
jgi:hypothetical protein